jgi:hypothetical protein
VRIFLSWSGERSRRVAEALRGWLDLVLQDLEVFVSTQDIPAGSRWPVALGAELERDGFGVLCLTADEAPSPWMLFEAGSIAKDPQSSRVVPFLFGKMTEADVAPPLSQFQMVSATKEGTLRLVGTINAAQQKPMPAEKLAKTFETWWPQLSEGLEQIGKEVAPKPRRRSVEEMVQEILEIVRAQRTPASQEFLFRAFDTARKEGGKLSWRALEHDLGYDMVIDKDAKVHLVARPAAQAKGVASPHIIFPADDKKTSDE